MLAGSSMSSWWNLGFRPSAVRACNASFPRPSSRAGENYNTSTSTGHSFISQTSLHIPVSAVVAASPPFLSSSKGMLPTPGDFPAFSLNTASSTSSLSTGRLLASQRGSGYSEVGLCLDAVHSCRDLGDEGTAKGVDTTACHNFIKERQLQKLSA